MEASGGQSLQGLLQRLAAVLVSAGRSVECGYNVAYARVTRPTTAHRNLRGVHQGVAIREHRREYERRFVAFFEEVLCCYEANWPAGRDELGVLRGVLPAG